VLALAVGAATLVVSLIGIPAATLIVCGSRRERCRDVVIDEAAGQLLALILTKPDWKHAAPVHWLSSTGVQLLSGLNSSMALN
jgi:hypothetical protein